MWPVENLRTYLSGSWRLDRAIVDHLLSSTGTMHGAAQFNAYGNSLINEERGTLSFGAHEGLAEQTYSYDFSSSDGRALVRFRDGRPFHELDLSAGETIVRHPCEPDRYEGRFTALDENHWQSDWTIVGPRKNLTIVTLYTRP